jgi:hypothetical protein
MAETLVIVSLPPLIALMGVILKVIVGLRNENRNDHGTVVVKLDALAEGHDELRADIRDVKADVRDLKSDHRQLDRELGSLQSLIGVPDE